MCLLTFLPTGVMPDLDALHNGSYFNRDGHGFAIVAGEQLLVQRGMDAEAMIEAFEVARRRHRHGPALFHSRLGTHGSREVGNCHPFPVGGDLRTVLAHNGILPRPVQPAKADPRSDTRIAAEQFLPRLGSLRHRRTRLQFERWMTPANKAVVLTVDRRFRKQSYILNEKSGIWDGGIWYSNDAYLPQPEPRWVWRHEPGSLPWSRLDDTIDQCAGCGAIVDVADTQCRCCGWCLDCDQPAEQCLCLAAARLGSQVGR